MIVAKWLVLALLMLPIAEVAAFIVVATQIGLLWALALMVATSLAGGTILRHAGGGHIARMRIVLGPQRGTALAADGSGLLVLIAGFLLLIPGFITDVLGILLLVAPLRRALLARIGRAVGARPDESIVDLAPQDYHRVPERRLPPGQRPEQR